MPVKKVGKAQQSARTRALLLKEARALFTELGFAGAGTELLLQRAGMTRGALYHHFRDKADLFRGVCEELHTEIGAEIEAAASEARGHWEGLAAGCDAFFDAAMREDVQRILLIDGPSVLGWEEWARMDRAHGFGKLIEGVRAAVKARELREAPAEALAVLMNGAMNDGVLWAARGEGRKRMRELKAAWRVVLEGLRWGTPIDADKR